MAGRVESRGSDCKGTSHGRWQEDVVARILVVDDEPSAVEFLAEFGDEAPHRADRRKW